MGDRVRFATVNDTVTPANSSGFSGFPFPVPVFDTVADLRTALEPAGGFYPVAITLPQAIKWYWRVKRWNITASAFLTLPDASPCDFEVTVDHDSPDPRGSTATHELDLIEPRDIAQTWGETYFAIDPVPDSVLVCSVTFFLFGWPTDGSPLARVGNDYYPNVFLNFEFSDAAWGACTVGIHDLAADKDGTSAVGLDGVVIPATVSGAWNPSLSIDPVEFWPYAGADTNPIYDTTTGTLLSGRSPLD